MLTDIRGRTLREAQIEDETLRRRREQQRWEVVTFAPLVAGMGMVLTSMFLGLATPLAELWAKFAQLPLCGKLLILGGALAAGGFIWAAVRLEQRDWRESGL